MDQSFKIDSNSLKSILSDTEAIIKSKIDLIDKESYKKYSLFIPFDYSLDSLILKDKSIVNLLYEMIPPCQNLVLIYRGSRDSFKAAVFH